MIHNKISTYDVSIVLWCVGHSSMTNGSKFFDFTKKNAYWALIIFVINNLQRRQAYIISLIWRLNVCHGTSSSDVHLIFTWWRKWHKNRVRYKSNPSQMAKIFPVISFVTTSECYKYNELGILKWHMVAFKDAWIKKICLR